MPCFVSDNYIVYFDPHASFLPYSTINSPGIKCDFKKKNLLEMFPDQVILNNKNLKKN